MQESVRITESAPQIHENRSESRRISMNRLELQANQL